MKVVFSTVSLEELKGIARYIARDNPVRARSFARELKAYCLSIGEMPYGSALFDAEQSSVIRARPYAAYLIFYVVEMHRVSILHVLHGARDHRAILFAAD